MNLKTKIISASVGLTLLAGGCMKYPAAGDFPKDKSLVAVPAHPVIMGIWGGVNKHKKLALDGSLTGIVVQKEHWLGPESEPRRFYAPKFSEGVGILDSPGLFRHNYWIGYTKDVDGDGKLDRAINHHSIDWNGNDPKLEETYIKAKDSKEDKYIKLEKR